ncbi:hypothetical protein MPC4_250046 [Methylocella tundrae]|uniref:Uncharacterized protein n=1 Tax=Methylocella tundrae TaxID=227605 RepID=A0A8B6M707_METTU|nr:hypothetical protein MPC4_250046 [Methylocella tundrae]
MLFREEWTRSGQGKKVDRRHCGQAIEAQPSFGQIRPFERPFGVVNLTEMDQRRTRRPRAGVRNPAATVGVDHARLAGDGRIKPPMLAAGGAAVASVSSAVRARSPRLSPCRSMEPRS